MTPTEQDKADALADYFDARIDDNVECPVPVRNFFKGATHHTIVALLQPTPAPKIDGLEEAIDISNRGQVISVEGAHFFEKYKKTINQTLLEAAREYQKKWGI